MTKDQFDAVKTLSIKGGITGYKISQMLGVSKGQVYDAINADDYEEFINRSKKDRQDDKGNVVNNTDTQMAMQYNLNRIYSEQVKTNELLKKLIEIWKG